MLLNQIGIALQLAGFLFLSVLIGVLFDPSVVGNLAGYLTNKLRHYVVQINQWNVSAASDFSGDFVASFSLFFQEIPWATPLVGLAFLIFVRFNPERWQFSFGLAIGLVGFLFGSWQVTRLTVVSARHREHHHPKGAEWLLLTFIFFFFRPIFGIPITGLFLLVWLIKNSWYQIVRLLAKGRTARFLSVLVGTLLILTGLCLQLISTFIS